MGTVLKKIAAGTGERKFNIGLFTVMIAHCIGYSVQGGIYFFTDWTSQFSMAKDAA